VNEQIEQLRAMEAQLRDMDAQHAAARRQVEEQLAKDNQALEQALAGVFERHATEEARIQALQERAKALQAAYSQRYDRSKDALTPDEYATFVKACLFQPRSDAANNGAKFLSDPKKLIIGEFEHAAGGFAQLCCVDEDEIGALVAQGLPAVRQEIEAYGKPGVLEHFDYVVNEASSEKAFPNGIRDKGREGLRLADYMKHPNAKTSGVKEAEVAALRIYTTAAYTHINEPLRDQERFARHNPHPLPALSTLIVRGLKKLRKVDASKASATEQMVLWRGMKDVEVTEEFITRGGTELGAMSTTSDLGVAIDYSRSRRSLIFKIITENKLQRGADLEWLSAFPNESEVLFPPLTYMQPTGKTQVVEIDGYHFTIVEVRTTTA